MYQFGGYRPQIGGVSGPSPVLQVAVQFSEFCPLVPLYRLITYVRAVAQPRAMTSLSSRQAARACPRFSARRVGPARLSDAFAVCAPRVRRESRPSSVAQPSSDADPGRCCRLGVRVRDRPNHTGDRARRAHAVRQLRRRPLASLQLHGLDDGPRPPWLGHCESLSAHSCA